LARTRIRSLEAPDPESVLAAHGRSFRAYTGGLASIMYPRFRLCQGYGVGYRIGPGRRLAPVTERTGGAKAVMRLTLA